MTGSFLNSIWVLAFLWHANLFLQSPAQELKSDTAYHAYFWHRICAKQTLFFDAITNLVMLTPIVTSSTCCLLPTGCTRCSCNGSSDGATRALASRGCKTKNIIIYHRISVIFILHDVNPSLVSKWWFQNAKARNEWWHFFTNLFRAPVKSNSWWNLHPGSLEKAAPQTQTERAHWFAQLIIVPKTFNCQQLQ